ncbi:hypothetical protein MCOR27_007892 [Pyricularia oryzae]|uniref:UTR2 protein-like protein n=5 Tax=Pyricularia TaxID=48558 RepID=Q5G5A1_PYRGI|nr:cell wall glucanase [Pyricularia oryzae 70-15]AAW69329.1 UTR2 protein-like protein [Pyricularia grisea]ELQ35647.1 UTR2 protein [Pyricularia oryzae Y34]KAH8840183.1 hypothetical protein MCOR01_006911 [Pyricularia oryzae]EHA48208.1 cell wall glucanase [Pyricularia oryzae 70-15]KAH9434530.1 hypothetical protein MCOR02_006528 [Pyricularia oryzae]
MKSTILSIGAAALLSAQSVLAADGLKCSLDKHCPKEAPCCGLYGDCGTGAFCLGGCDPRMSFSLDSCVPEPTCQSKKFTFNSKDRIQDVSEYLGDASKADWVVTGEPLFSNGNLLLTMPPRSVGTVLSSTHYMWYGNVKAKMKTSRGRGVVTAFILFSDVKDEIDYEWVGVDLETTQTNYYFQGIPKYDQSGNITGTSNTFENYHEYEINWTPDEITWLVDGKKGRTKKRSETWNATAQQWDFPQTPSRVQFSIWPGGADTNPKGTVDWAGGAINWVDHPDLKDPGYYYAMVSEVEIKCWDGSNGVGTNKGKTYYYNSARGTNDTVVDSDKNGILSSLQATGLDMNKGGDKSKPDASTTGVDIPSVPGGSGVGPGQAGTNQGGGQAAQPPDNCFSDNFVQKCGTGGSSKNAGGRVETPSILSGSSAFAVVVAFAGLVML